MFPCVVRFVIFTVGLDVCIPGSSCGISIALSGCGSGLFGRSTIRNRNLFVNVYPNPQWACLNCSYLRSLRFDCTMSYPGSHELRREILVSDLNFTTELTMSCMPIVTGFYQG